MPVNLYCEKYPALAKSDTLFIHGNLASTVWWQPTLKEWQRGGSEGEGRLLFCDWRGCGRNSDWSGDKTFSVEDLARDFLNMLEEQGLQKVGLVGHSLGGLIALQMMVLAPEKFSKAVLLDPVGPQGVVFDDGMYEAFRQMAANSDLTRTVILSTIRNSENLEEGLRTKMAADAFKAVRGIGSSVLETLKTVNIREALQSVSIPTLILHGEHDQIIPLKDSEDLAKVMPNARLEKLASAGHCWNVEDPAAFTKRVKEWFA